jgi:hypothetical protein
VSLKQTKNLMLRCSKEFAMFRILMSLSLSTVFVLALTGAAEAKGNHSGPHHNEIHGSMHSKDFHWNYRYWNSRYGCYFYTCPGNSYQYYWYETEQCYVPVTYIEELPPVVITIQPRPIVKVVPARVVVETPTVVSVQPRPVVTVKAQPTIVAPTQAGPPVNVAP